MFDEFNALLCNCHDPLAWLLMSKKFIYSYISFQILNYLYVLMNFVSVHVIENKHKYRDEEAQKAKLLEGRRNKNF